MKTLLFVLLFSASAFGGFEKITVQNLDLEYAAPYGKGMVDRVGIGVGLVNDPYEVEINRTDDTFELTSPYVDFTWLNPLKFIHDIEKLSAKKTSLALGTKGGHFVVSDSFMFKPKGMGIYSTTQLNATCEGDSVGEFTGRLVNDCLNHLELSIKKIDVPGNFILNRLIEDLPLAAAEMDAPADNVVAEINKGDIFLQFYIKWIFYAGLRSWGHVQLENNRKVIAIRVDQIKFGILPVTGIVMKKLKELNTSPNVTIDPPWIRINTEGMN